MQSVRGPGLSFVVAGAALALILSASCGIEAKAADGAWSTATANRLMIVPNTPEGFAALSNARARVVASYDEFTLVEVHGRRVRGLLRAGGELRDDMRTVRVGQHTFDPTVASPYLMAKTGRAPRLTSRGGYGLEIVQYVGPLKRAWIAAVQATGVEVVTYMAQNAQLVVGTPKALAALSELAASRSFIRAVIPFDAEAKQKPGLQASGTAEVVISTVAGRAGDSSRATIASFSSPRGSAVTVAGFVNQRVTLNAANIGFVAELGGVVAIEPWVEPKLLDERAATIVAGRVNSSFLPVLGTGYLDFLRKMGFSKTSNVVIDITDEGIDKGVVPAPAGSHPAFYRFGDETNANRIMYAQEATADPDARDCGGHGTNVASIAAGFNKLTGATHEDAAGFNYALGIHPYGRLGATKIFNCAGSFDVATSVAALHGSAYGMGARISNNSWGANVGGAYNTRSQEFDSLVRDAQPGTPGNQQFTEVVSAGNSGTAANSIGSPGTAKNVITVGASENVRAIGGNDGCGVPDTGADSARDIINFSSRGPTDDGRIKPDIVAPGTHVSGAQPQTGADYNGSGTCNPAFPAGSTLYNLVSGTSQAAPEVTGFASLIYSWYHDNFAAYPSPAMTKALMINTATDLVGGNDGAGGTNASVPTQIQGWGRINLGNLVSNTTRELFDQVGRINGTGTAHTRYFNVAATSDPVRVSLVWTDPVGPTVGNSFVNDLDLEVTAGGQIFKGNVFSGGVSIPGGTADPRNNAENVFLRPGVNGKIRVRVIGTNVPGDGVPNVGDATDQDYALVVSNATEAATAPVLQYLGNTVTPGGDGDNFLEPGETFTISAKLRNLGNATATSVTGTLSGGGAKAIITQANGNWANIAAGASKFNTTLFSGKVKNGTTCGDSINMNLAISSTAGSFTVPITLATGTPRGSLTVVSTDVPKVIPDNNGTGVSSVLQMTGGGTVKSLRVTVSSLSHTFDGDLEIDLKSPAGTTVRLFDQRGGSGDNLTNTVFSDAGTTPISSGIAPFTGTFIPEAPLSTFDGEPAAGTWTLIVRDLANLDTGNLNGWSLTRAKPPGCN